MEKLSVFAVMTRLKIRMSNITKALRLLRDFIGYNIKVERARQNKDILAKNAHLQNSQSGEVFILLTGSSLKDKDLSWLKDKKTIACNFFFMSQQYKDLDVDFWTFIESWRHEQIGLLTWGLENAILKRNNMSNKMKIFLSSSAYAYYKDPSIFFASDREINETLKLADFFFVSGNGDFENQNDINNQLDAPCNVLNGTLYFAIGLSIYLGFKKIYLLGSDYACDPIRIGHFYDEFERIWSKEKVDEYGKYSLFDTMNRKQRAINNFAISKGVNLINVVDEGYQSRIFNSVTYAELMRNYAAADKDLIPRVKI